MGMREQICRSDKKSIALQDSLRVLRTEVQVLRSSEAALKSQIAERISELQETSY